jgi:hypothetical protein
MQRLLFFFAFCPLLVQAQTPAPFARLKFLLGTSEAKTAATGSAVATVLGTYTFQADFAGTVITRAGSLESCKGPASSTTPRGRSSG